MRENPMNKFYALGVTVLLVLLAIMFLIEKKDTAKEVEENMQIAEKVKREEEERQVKVDEIYSSLLKDLEKAPAGFVCWGDSEMVGSSYGSFPSSLRQKIDETYYLNFEKDFLHLAGANYARIPRLDVVNRGVVDEGLNEIMVRAGAHKLMVGEDFFVPSDNIKKNILLKDINGHMLLFAVQPYAVFGTVTIDGIKGNFYSGYGSYDELHPRIAFEREESGDSYTIPAGTEIEIDEVDKYIDYYPILYFSENDNIEVGEFIECMQEIIRFYGIQDNSLDNSDKNDKKSFAIICTTEEGSDWDNALNEAFGECYFRNDIIVDDMTAENYESLSNRIVQFFESQGVFDEVKNAIDQAGEQLRIAEND